uniref:Secreted protein n=1 Tax=Rhipicephalus appendiculatus TaxID=34631 RepID=A0A131YVH3_RHIAP
MCCGGQTRCLRIGASCVLQVVVCADHVPFRDGVVCGLDILGDNTVCSSGVMPLCVLSLVASAQSDDSILVLLVCCKWWFVQIMCPFVMVLFVV